MKPVRIIGVGSPFGTDTLGWELLLALAEHPLLARECNTELSFKALDRPGVGVLEEMRDARCVFIIDTVRTDPDGGRLLHLDPNHLLVNAQPAACHGFGLAESLRLGAVLGMLPKDLHIYGIAVGNCGRNPPDEIELDVIIDRLAEDIHNVFRHSDAA
jgi:hydrogenase maturation protease